MVLLIKFQMTLMMMRIWENSPKFPFTELSQSTAMQATPWTNTPPWFVIHTSFSEKMLGSFCGCDFLFICYLFFPQELKAVLLGTSLNCFSVEWRNQGLTFSETHDLRYGIVQKKVAFNVPSHYTSLM